jgi:hypothetical protein
MRCSPSATIKSYGRRRRPGRISVRSRRRSIEVIRRFNTEDALRILLTTDATRERLNFQAHCADPPFRNAVDSGPHLRASPVGRGSGTRCWSWKRKPSSAVWPKACAIVTLSAGWIIALFPALLLKKADHLEIGGHCAAPSSIGGRR